MKVIVALVTLTCLLGCTGAEYTAASLGDVPYQVSIWQMYESYTKENKTIFMCAGALISNEWVLTTATCVDKAERGGVLIRLGAGHLRKDNSSDVGLHDALEVHKHEDYDPFYGYNDIALIKVTPGFVESTAVKPVTVRETPVALETPCTASGWSQPDSDNQEVLKVGKIRNIDKEENCYTFFMTPSVYKMMLCAGIPGTENGTCNAGEIGGPLVCEDQLTGLYFEEFGLCLSETTGSLYLDVTSYVTWINAIMAGLPPPTTSTTTPLPTTTRTTAPTTTRTTTPKPTNDEAALGDIPYHVSIWYQWDLMGETHVTLTCSGTLVKKEYVLTSAKCVNEANRRDNSMKMAAAHLSIKNVTGVIFHDVDQIIQHENYSEWGNWNNIALVKVTPPFEETDLIKAVPIRQSPAAVGTPCRISGWQEDYFETSDVLKTKDVSYLERDQCSLIWNREKRDDTLCAGIPSDQPGAMCNVGEEGGPLVCDGLLTGMYSEDDNLCISGKPAIYTDVEFYHEWVLDHLPEGGFETTTGKTTGTTDSPGAATSSTASGVVVVLLTVVVTWMCSV